MHDDLVGVPDFLEWTDEPSEFGDFSYRPVDVKISTTPKAEHEAQLAFYAILLGGVQGLVPEGGDLILVDMSRAGVELDGPVETVRQMVDEVRRVKAGGRELPTLSTGCGMCPWHDHCLRTLYAIHDISLIDGLSTAKKPGLVESGYTDLSAIAGASPDALCTVKGIGDKTARRMVAQAAVLLEQRPRVIAVPELPETEIELYVDMECQQQTQVIYLIGVLECRKGEPEEFHAFVAERPEDEGKMWSRFLAYVRGLPRDPVIYHYHNFEATHLRKLAERHGIDPNAEARLFGNLVDLHRVLKESVVLPVHSYGLKAVAKWLGFKWSETDADAALSMLWFDMWLSTGERRYLELSIEYNEDDCRATKVVKEWLTFAVGR